MFVSVVINNYNYGRYLRDAINSSLKQSYLNREIIVVDDGSSDNSVEVIESYGDSVVSVLKTNGGQASAMNAGYLVCRGDIVLFLDSDDWLEDHAIETIVSHFRPGVSHLYWGLRKRGPDGEDLGMFKLKFPSTESGIGAWRSLLDRGAANFPPTSANAFSRETLDVILPIPEEEFRIRADVYLLYRAPFYGEVVSIKKELCNYRVHGENSWFYSNESKRRRIFNWRMDLNEFEESLARAEQKFGLLELGKSAKGGFWGRPALLRLIKLRVKQLVLLRCYPDGGGGSIAFEFENDIRSFCNRLDKSLLDRWLFEVLFITMRIVPASMILFVVFRSGSSSGAKIK